MNFLDKLERKFGKYAIKNLMLYIMMGTVVANLIFNLLSVELFLFNMQAILKGQVWRIVTFVFAEYYTGGYLILLFLFVSFYHFIGSTLENCWGTFKFNVYYFTGVLSTIAVCTIFYFASGYIIPGTPRYIHLSLFLAFATLFPEHPFNVFFLFPVKAKYLGIIDACYLFFDFMLGGIVSKALITVSLLNYFIFFGLPYLKRRRTKTQKEFIRASKKLKGHKRIEVAFHKCTVCGKTELDDPNLEFRYCMTCNGNYEYCMEHLKNHTHKE